MRMLILGGTAFVGRHLVNAALGRGHEVVLFNRGRNNLFVELETILGDRDPNVGLGLHGLKGRDFDAVIDVSGYVPRIVRASAECLREVRRYCFVSSISVYATMFEPGLTETAAVETMPDPNNEDVSAHYGALKVLCEQAVEQIFGPRALLVRPGLIVGPFDHTDRFTYWPVRTAHHLAQGSTMLAPGRPQRLVQFIDARDLADWVIQALEQDLPGTFHLTGHPTPMQALVAPNAHWVNDEFLERHKVNAWMGPDSLPFWIPEGEAEPNRSMQLGIAKALGHGLQLRPLRETLDDTLAWAQSRDPKHEWRSGITLEREQALLIAAGR